MGLRMLEGLIEMELPRCRWGVTGVDKGANATDDRLHMWGLFVEGEDRYWQECDLHGRESEWSLTCTVDWAKVHSR